MVTIPAVVKQRAWRWRRCPSCRNVERASDYQIIGGYRPGWRSCGDVLRACPACGHKAATRAFGVVREARANV